MTIVNILNESKGIITLEFEGVTKEELRRFKETIDTILLQGVLHLHDGKAILSFDYEGTLREIHVDYVKWRKKKVDN